MAPVAVLSRLTKPSSATTVDQAEARKKGRGLGHKHKVLTLVDRNRGRSRSMVVDYLKAETIGPISRENVAKEAL